ncbi:hypothetical protein ANN_05025 [Periplaneta americana]|uniref:Tyr recombinase domain-containing protein n=1 Tax=Periplaneta americana TaxID=6978 RepID=A0ABQ8TC33_PERAM|nr:hypothetical protein ANN_05025 [Periplaneta americana]
MACLCEGDNEPTGDFVNGTTSVIRRSDRNCLFISRYELHRFARRGAVGGLARPNLTANTVKGPQRCSWRSRDTASIILIMAATLNEGDVDLDVEEAWEQGCASLVPDKSRARYERAYNIFTNWFEGKEREINENTMLAYFVKRTTTLKSANSLWSEYSMLKTMINLKYGINIGQFSSLVNFLKKKNVGQMPKKSKVFDREDMIKFLIEAPDDTYLMMKVVIMGRAGACRRNEITNLTIDDIEDRGSVIVVNIPNTKTKISRTFTIIDKPDEEVHFLEIFRKYVNLRPINSASRRFFHRFSNGKCTNQVVEMNTIGRVPSNIAKFLNLNDPDSYTGHAFRRTSATLLANTGADILALKRHGGWKSSTVAEGYVQDSIYNKIKSVEKILHDKSNIGTRIHKTATTVSSA